MRKQKKFLSALLLLALFVGLLPTFRVTADATFATQKNYTISGEDVFQYSYTPDRSGLYEVEVQGCDKGLNPRISFTDAEGNTPLRAGANDFYSSTKATIYYLEQGKTYTFTHSVIEEDLSCLLTISHYNATTLTLNKATSFRADPVAFFEFFPTEDGWYTFTGPKEDWNVVLDWIWVDGQSLLDGEPYVFSDGGVHLYFKGGSRVYFGIMGWTSHNGTMTVKKSIFPTVLDEETVTLSINNTDMEVYALAYQYASFTAPYTGRYELNLSYGDMYDWTLSAAIYDSDGNEVTGEGFDRSTMLGYWNLTAGETYAVGATGLSSSLNGRVTVQLTCVEWDAEPETPKLCEKHKYTSATGNTCTVCGYEFEPKLTAYSKTLYVAKDIVPVRDNYYSKSSTVVETLTKGTAVKVTHKLQNALGNEWYVTDTGKYIYVKNLTATAPNAHTLTFNANGGTGAPASITTVAAKYGIPSSKPKRNGYTFLGWSTNKNATTEEYKAGQAVSMTKNLTLYAVWKKKTNDYRERAEELVDSIRNGTHPVCQIGDRRTEYTTWFYTYNRDVSWCSVYASWFLVGELGVSAELKTASCNTHFSQLKKEGCYHAKGRNYEPQTGDLLFFSEDGSNIGHVGIAVITDGELYVLHGNYSSKVSFSHISKTWKTQTGMTLEQGLVGYGDIESYIDATTED